MNVFQRPEWMKKSIGSETGEMGRRAMLLYGGTCHSALKNPRDSDGTGGSSGPEDDTKNETHTTLEKESEDCELISGLIDGTLSPSRRETALKRLSENVELRNLAAILTEECGSQEQQTRFSHSHSPFLSLLRNMFSWLSFQQPHRRPSYRPILVVAAACLVLIVSATLYFSGGVGRQPGLHGAYTIASTPQLLSKNLNEYFAATVCIGFPEGWASGTLLGPDGLIITSSHLWPDALEEGEAGPYVYLYPGNRELGLGLATRVISFDESKGLALIQMIDPSKVKTLAAPVFESPEEDSRVLLIGQQWDPESSAKSKAVLWKVRNGTGRTLESRGGASSVIADIKPTPGDLGAPLLLLESGNVAGICTVIKKYDAEHDEFALPKYEYLSAASVKTFLREAGVWTENSSAP